MVRGMSNRHKYVSSLGSAQLQALQAAERQARILDERNRYRAIQLSAQGLTVAEISRVLGICQHTVRRAFQRYAEAGASGLKEGARSSRKPKIPP